MNLNQSLCFGNAIVRATVALLRAVIMETVAPHLSQLLCHGFGTRLLWQLRSEKGEQQNDYALLVVLVVVAALAIVFVVGPQVAMVYAQSAQTGVGTP